MHKSNPHRNKVIYLLDDSEDNLFLVKELLLSVGFENTRSFTRGRDLLDLIKEDKALLPDLFLSDIMMPDVNGIDLCEELKQIKKCQNIPVVLITAQHGDEVLNKGFEAGAHEFLRRPVSKVELLCRLKVLFDFHEICEGLRLKNQELTVKSMTDGLTGLYNRACLDQRLDEEFSKSKRYHLPMSLVMLDIDHFKNVNDNYGHPIGDEVLKSLSNLLLKLLRTSDIVALYGGEEITLILCGTELEKAVTTADRIRKTISETPMSQTHPDLRITVSMGVSTCGLDTLSSKDLITHADNALLEAKNNGKNIVKVHSA